MKLSLIFILITCFELSAYTHTYGQKISLRKTNVPLEEVLKDIQKQSGYHIFYDVNLTDKEPRISLLLNEVSLKEALDEVFKGSNLGYHEVKKNIIIVPITKVESIVQQKMITGRVRDKNNQPLEGVTVALKGTQRATTTNEFGYYSILVGDVSKALIFSIVGFEAMEVNIDRAGLLIDVVLNDMFSGLDEVVVVGYSAQKKETLTGAISTVKGADLLTTTSANISNSLVGRVPGISATQSSGEAGQNAASIKIRGVATLNTSGQDPLIVVDGIQSTMEIMNAIDPNEIDNISVLKDASSTAVYGVKGANGVIIISTKRGSSGSPKINLSYRSGISTLTSKLKMVDSYDYAVFRNEAIENDKIAGNYQFIFTDDELWKFKNNRDFTPAEVEAMSISDEEKIRLNNSPALYYRSNDYVDDLFGGVSPQSQFNINLGGGGDKLDYFISLGNFSEEGILNNSKYEGKDVNSKYNRYNIRSNIDLKVHQKLKLSLDFGGQFSESDGTLATEGTSMFNRYRELWNSLLSNPPYSGPGVLNGKLVDSYSQQTNPLANKGAAGSSALGVILSRHMLKRITSNMDITGKLDYDLSSLVDGLSLSGTVSYNDTYTKGVQTNKHIPFYGVTRNPEMLSELLFFGGSSGPHSFADNQFNNKWNRTYLETKLDYSKTIDKHAVTGLILYNIQTTKYPSLQYKVAQNLIGTAARVTYGYDNKYLGEFNMGYNGSENFPEGKRFGFFPSFSVGWIISEEAFFQKNSFVSWLKLRGSYGIVGNDQIGGDRFLYLPNSWKQGGNRLLGGYPFGNTSGSFRDPHYTGAMEDRVGNPNVTWEKARKTNLGLDLHLLKNKLTFTGDYFHEKRSNILWRLGTVPGIVAADLAPANIGVVENQGYELSLGWKDQIGDFVYGVSGNLSYAKNKIIFMDEPSYPYEWMNTTGYSIGQYKGFQMEGFYNNESEASNRPYVDFDGNHVAPGDVRYIDINGDGKIDAEDQTPLGYSNLPLYSFSSNVLLGYKGFGLNVLLNGTRGGSILMNSIYISNPFYTVHGNALQYQFDGRWTPQKVEKGITPDFPKASIRTFDSQNGRVSDLWLKSTQFIRLKNVELSYNFTNIGKLKNIGFSGIKLYTNGTNLITWGSKLIDGYDPEQMATAESAQGFLYPPTRTYNFGITLQF